MKKIKYLSLILILVLAITSIFFKDQLIAFAEKYDIETAEPGKIYNHGDDLVIYEESDFGSSYYYDVMLEKLTYIAYEDANGNLMYFYSPLAAGSGIFSSEETKVGYDCKSNLIHYEEEFLKDNEYYQSLTEEEKKEYYDDVLGFFTNICYYGEMYSGNSIHLNEVEKWIVVESKYKTIGEYCENSSAIRYSKMCDEFIPNSGGSSGPDLTDNKVITLREYQVPEFEFTCEPATIKYKEKTECELKVNTAEKIVEIITSLNNEELHLEDVVVKEGWKLIESEDGNYVLENEEGFSGNGVVLTATLTANKNENKQVEIRLDDLTYKTKFGATNTTDLPSNVTVESVEENPETADVMIVIIIALFTASGYFIIKSYKQKKVLS